MKKNLYATFLILGIVFLCLTVSNCGKEEEGITGKGSQDAANQLINALNKPLIGLTVKVDPANISTKPSGAKRLLVTFKNPAMSFNTAALKKTAIGAHFKEMEIPITIEEVTYLYGPEEKYLEAVSLKGMAFHWDAKKLMEMAGQEKP
ncbi:MAG: hypothetical protein GY950_01190, partial [bacterium]|nr:hypothetical protein [bacterium]